MELEIDYTKSVEDNANSYYIKAKQYKKKLEGLKKAKENFHKKLEQQEQKQEKQLIERRKHAWYENFRWFFTSDNSLVIAGRNAKMNDLVYQKHLDSDDLFFHTEISGSPAVILKGKASEQSKLEAAIFTASFSSAWKSELSSVNVYSVSKEQVSKSAPSGTFLATGSFMIYGQREWYKKTPLDLALGIDSENRIISGPPSAIKKHSKIFFILKQGKKSKSDTAKDLKNLFSKKSIIVSTDEIIKMLPEGKFSIEVKQ